MRLAVPACNSDYRFVPFLVALIFRALLLVLVSPLHNPHLSSLSANC